MDYEDFIFTDVFSTEAATQYNIMISNFTQPTTKIEWIFYIAVTFIVVIVMMNLFIAVVGMAFDANMANKERGEYKQLCEITLELETFVCCGKKRREMNCKSEHLIWGENMEFDKCEFSGKDQEADQELREIKESIVQLRANQAK
jgi:hypothetical protein